MSFHVPLRGVWSRLFCVTEHFLQRRAVHCRGVCFEQTHERHTEAHAKGHAHTTQHQGSPFLPKGKTDCCRSSLWKQRRHIPYTKTPSNLSYSSAQSAASTTGISVYTQVLPCNEMNKLSCRVAASQRWRRSNGPKSRNKSCAKKALGPCYLRLELTVKRSS